MPDAAEGPTPRFALAGVWSNILSVEQLLAAYRNAIDRNEHLLVGNVNLHGLYLSRHDTAMAEFYRRADLVYIDGMPIVWWLRSLGAPARPRHRITLVDWLPTLLAEAAGQHWRVFYLGGRPGVARALGTRFRAMLPELMFRERHGYFDATAESAENRGVVAQIQAFEPHILLVGMGMPRQEAWVMANLAHLPPCVVQPCGAVADYFAGVIPTPPRILARVGLEGVCRLFHEPRRLWRRYLLEPLALVPAFVADVAGQTRPSGRNDQPSSA